MEWQIVEPDRIPALAQKMQGWKAAVVDVESAGDDHRIIGLGLSPYDSEQHYYLPLDGLNKLDMRPFIEPLETMILMGHNIKYDLHALSRLGWVGRQLSFIDTIVLARLWAKDEHPRLGLKELGKQIFNFEYPNLKVVQMVRTGKADKIPLPDLAEYCCTDLWLTKRLYRWLKENLSPRVLQLFVRETYLTRDLFDMEQRGVMVDKEYLQTAVEKLDKELAGLLDTIRNFSGIEEFNARSNPQKRQLMEQLKVPPVAFGKTGPSWDRDALLEVRTKHPVAMQFAKYQALTYQRNGMIERAIKAGDILHGEFKNWGTVTGRLSSDMQQLPKGWLQFGSADESGEDVLVWLEDKKAREKEFSIRRLLRPRPGYILIKADYSQIEMFVLGYYMKDRTFSRWLDSGNVHAAAALEVFGDAELYYERGKVYNFATVYGQGEAARAKALHCTTEEARRYREEYERRMPGYRKFLWRVRRLLERDGVISNFYGRQYSPDLAYKGVNYLVQGSAGDYVKFKLPDTRQLRQQIGLEMLITTHDDFIAEIPEENKHLLPEWVETLHQSPFERDLGIDVDYSRSSLVELNPLKELLDG